MGPGTLTHGSGIPGQRFITRNHLLWGGPLAGQAFRPRGCTRPSALGFTAQDRMDGSCSDSHVSSQPQASPSHPRGDTAQLPLHSQDRRTAPSPPASQPAPHHGGCCCQAHGPFAPLQWTQPLESLDRGIVLRQVVRLKDFGEGENSTLESR